MYTLVYKIMMLILYRMQKLQRTELFTVISWTDVSLLWAVSNHQSYKMLLKPTNQMESDNVHVLFQHG